jgi:predicted nucleic acid-binding protein
VATIDDVRIVVSDAGPLIHLDELACLDVLDFCEIWVPDAVWDEVSKHRPEALRKLNSALRRKPGSDMSPRITAIVPLFGLHRGEREALALCLEHPQSLLLTDDAAARLAATSLNLTAHGTVGLVIRAVRRGLRTPGQGLQLLQDIPQKSSLHIRPSLLARIILQVKQEWGE